jgi:Na+/H+ antiporter NhaC
MIRTRVAPFSLLLCLLIPAVLGGQAPGTPASVEAPSVAVPGAPFKIEVSGPEGAPYRVVTATGREIASGSLGAEPATVEGLVITGRAELPLSVLVGPETLQADARFVPGWASLLPPLVAILLALIFREVVVSLFAGVWLGAFFWTGFDPLAAVLRTVDSFALPALADPDHAAIIIFSLSIGGMVGVITRNGGTHGIVERLAPYATSPRRGLLATYGQGLAIFFDDYANTLIVGNTMRPVTDRLRVSREKLAYVVDSTSAPVASVMFVSTWVGYEISLIADGLRSAAASVSVTNPAMAARLTEASAFNVFIDTIPYRFYPLLALVFVLLVIWMRRDFGPMYGAEARAAAGRGVYREGAALMADTSAEALEPPAGSPLRWWNAGLPVLVVVGSVVIGLYASGRAALGPGDWPLRDVVGEANSFHVLLWGSLLGSITAILLTASQRILSLQETMNAWLAGLRSMVLAMVILVLAWSLGAVTEALGTAQYLSSVLAGNVPLHLLPVLVFIVAAVVSFATGTSWGTMAILIPLVIPLGASLTAATDLGIEGHYTILLGVVSSVLAGSIFGDHCSPISDTTVLSSMASACDHMDHVRTQLPYAVMVAVVAMVLGDIPTAFGMSPWISLLLGTAVLVGVLRVFGRRSPHLAATAGPGAGEAVPAAPTG